ncbi:ubiquitin carboxyl-terminal hydrolase 26-like isoform X2 [Xenia sp. Carnegie-2017]|uniref:ubiquitin carboxyl-terminal hydrolase 26-like isoform X2 n=1 Tax=Xenia sp. Carnegie-2017 TaxID=2897299 RepID=UPI001F03E833|nr:ubiquitin carboxyl-terminal hydrolase 26-like isoform X2 [Xenia sp. Carnegie-2017]
MRWSFYDCVIFLLQDAHEFLNICLHQLIEEVQHVSGTTFGESNIKVCPVSKNFEGCLRKYIKCTEKDCSGGIKMNALFGNFFKNEELERKCEKCECATAVQNVKIISMPRIIILHLVRSEFDPRSGIEEKNSNRINADRHLKIGNFCSENVSGPPPLNIKDTSNCQFNLDDDGTPFLDNPSVLCKSRRRLNMSSVEDEWSGKNGLNSLESSNENLFLLSETELLELAKRESVKENETFTCKENIGYSSKTTARLKGGALHNFYSGTRTPRKRMLSFDEMNNKEESDKNIKKLPRFHDDARNKQKQGKRKTGLTFRRLNEIPMDSEESDDFVSNKKRNLAVRNSNDGKIPPYLSSGRLKGRTSNEVVGSKKEKWHAVSEGNEEDDLMRAVELSKIEHDKKALEQSQLDQAILLSLQDARQEAVVDTELHQGTSDLENDDQKNKDDFMYRIVSVVSHRGSTPSGGHYVSDVYDVKNEQWNRYDDIRVRKIKEYTVRYDEMLDGYIYFYMHRLCIKLLQE